jgi:hypothetical protein
MLNPRFWRRWTNLKKAKPPKRRLQLETLEDRTLLSNQIVAENALTGTPQSTWDVSGGGSSNIVGFTDQISYTLGQTVNFKINTSSTHYRLDIYRMGYYQGNGARLITSISKTLGSPQVQPAGKTDPTTGLIDDGNWGVSASWTIPTTLVSGVYFAKLVRLDSTSGSNHVFFVVRDDSSHSDLLYQTSDTTWEAYNTYAGISLYDGNPTSRAFAVSYNRPFTDRTVAGGFGSYDWIMHAEYPMIRFLERNGYDVSYFTHVDDAARGAEIKNHKAFLSVGHDEYWADDELNAVTAARDAGVNLAFFSGNDVFWKTRWANSIDGSNTPFRTLITYKETFAGAPTDPADPPTWTGTWMDPRFSPPADGGRPQNALTGQLWTVNRGPTDLGTSLQVPATYSNLRFWRNTAVAKLTLGQVATLGTDTIGYESDSDVDNGFRPAGLFDMSFTSFNSTSLLQDYGGNTTTGTATNNLTMYRAKSGALVFCAGSVQWSWGLDGTHDDGSFAPDPSMQQATINLLADMGAQPGSIMSGMVAATASTDHTAPTSVINFPTAASGVATNVPLTLYGTATDAGGGVVAGVEVSVDGGATWHPANGTNNWTYVWTPNTNGTVTILSRAVDDSGNLETPSAGITVTAVGPLSLLSNQITPDITNDPDGSAVELGVKFRSDVAGFISAIRFYKGPNNLGTHVGNLWSSTGTLLATATFSNETASGWQTVKFSNPVAIAANTTYVASYHSNGGHYVDTGNYWRSTTTNGPLHALGNGVDGPNGVFAYGSLSAFPNQAGNNPTNYFVDVLFSTSSTDTTPPEILAVSPTPKSSGLITTTTVSATFTESVQASTISFVLKDSKGNAVPASVTYNDTNHQATLTPNAALAGNSTYTASVSGAKDQAGNTMLGTVTWSFTTSGLAATGPFSIWNSSATPATVNDPDASAIEVGVKFRADENGYVTGVRFYKGSNNTGTHVGDLWTSTGTNLGSVTFTNETASGWQQANFSAPIAISANTTYIISYHTNVGHYSDTGGYFASSGVDNSPLHALAAGVDGPNGVYNYGASSTFPSQNNGASTNYWVDLVFSTTTIPTVTAQSPAPGATGVSTSTNVQATFNVSVQASTVSFVLKDASNNTVPATVSYNDPTHTVTLTPNAPLAANATYTATVSGAQDVNGNPMSGPVTWSFTTAAVIVPGIYSVFSSSATPATVSDPDGSAVELGMKFRSDVAGQVTGVRFYKGSTNTGTHVGNLWTSTGTLLATITFTGETASGWQQANFSSPVTISPNTTYVISYHTNVGHYSDTGGFFATSADNPPLHGLANGVDGPNGVYTYGSNSIFPTSTFNSTNYWVDVVFSNQSTVPTVTGQTPAPNATGVAANTTVTATFNESVTASTIAFSLKNSSGTVIPATVSYNDTTHTATLTPSMALAGNTTYTATVSGAKDANGNVMAGPVTWSFTTAAVTGPTVTSTSPTSGATNVVTTTPVKATFSVSVQASTISFVLKDSGGNTVPASVAYDNTSFTATLTPSALLKTSTTYTATVSGAKDQSGNVMANPVSWSFTTEAAPAVTSQTPASGATNVVTTTPVKATFNKSVVAASITFTLKDSGGNAVAGSVAYDNTTFTATLTPSALLKTSTTYTATVSAAQDASGNPLAAPVSWSFMTEAAPAVTSQSPTPGTTGVPANTTVKATFNKSVTAASIGFVLKDPSGNTVASSVAYDNTTFTATLTPSAALILNTTYTATVSGATDSSGNVLPSPTSWSFTTGLVPTVTTQSPAAGATNVVTTTPVKATFNESVVASSIVFVLKDSGGSTVASSVAYDNTTFTATLTPSALLNPSTTYTATVSGAKDSNGTTMAAPVSWSFTTEAAPAVTTQSPASGTTNVVTTTPVKATFSKAVQAGTISFVLKNSAGTAITATVSYDAPSLTATLTPSALLTPSTTYTATVSGAQDTSGNTMAAPVSWSFTTEAAPAVTSQSPPANATNVATTTPVKATFNKSVVASSIVLTLKDSGGTTVAGTLAYDNTTFTATLTPSALLKPSTVYTATVSAAQDSSGNSLAAPTSWSFTTEAAPAVTGQSPAPGSTAVATNTPVKATFNKSVVASSITFVLKDPSGTAVGASVAYDNTTFTATLTPSAALALNTTYTATVSGAKDSSGNVLAAPVSWSFTTTATLSGLVAAYAFNEGSGTTVTDASGKGHTGTISNATWTTAGKYGSALSFNGTNASVTINDANDLDLSTGMTLEAWVQPTANATFYSAAIAKEQRSDPANDVAYALYTADGGGNPPSVHGLFGSGGGADQLAKGGSVLGLNVWTHLAGTFDGTNLRLYVNGTLVATQATTGNSMTATTGALRIGGDFANEFFTGLIDEVRIYNRALSQSEIQTDMGTAIAATPAVTAQSPTPAATNVATTTAVKATFNESVVASSISFVLKDASGTVVPATVAYDNTTFTAILTPSAALATSTTYTATVSGAKDASGNVLPSPVSWSFTTEAAPAVTNQSPSSGATNVATTTPVKATFSKSVVTASLAFTLKDATGNTVPTTLTYDNTTFTATLTPSAALANSATYTATVSAAKDADGNALAAPVSWSFTTAAAVIPAVTTETPAPGATGVASTTTVKATFNESVVASSISFVLKDASGTVVPATVAYDNTTFTATLTPSAALAGGKTYTATVSGVKDANGNTMTGSTSWSFTTATNVWTQSSVSDFSAGTVNGTLVTNAPTPGVQLAPSFQDDFVGTTLTANWTTVSYSSLGGGPLSVSVANSIVALTGGDVRSTNAFTSTTVAEGRVNFGAATFQHFGLSTGFDNTTGNYWAVFSTFNTTDTLFARVNLSGVTTDVNLGALPSGFHVYTVKPTATAFLFYVDGVLQTTINTTFPSTVQPRLMLSAFSGSPAPAIQADWIRVVSYPSTGTFTSSVFDSAKAGSLWGVANWTANLPAGTTLTVQTRSGNTATPDATWSAWTSVANGGTVASPSGRFLQYQITLTTTDPTLTPTLFSISFNWS